jgi:hypothetical protein
MTEMKVLGPQNEAEIESFEREKLKALPGDDFEKEMTTWKARWRKEALAHYLNMGWSFGIWDNNQKLVGYSLGQPLLFFQGFTQALWIEHISSHTPEVHEKLVEISYKWARDKHLQRVVFGKDSTSPELQEKFSMKSLTEDILQVKTSKYE